MIQFTLKKKDKNILTLPATPCGEGHGNVFKPLFTIGKKKLPMPMLSTPDIFATGKLYPRRRHEKKEK